MHLSKSPGTAPQRSDTVAPGMLPVNKILSCLLEFCRV
ncbi:hypothetical protein vBPaeTR_14 [Pseudomonas phage vB_Pae_TR]|nr:hypothetical protein vBPaeTR_14 [Pseudomonas phage vB_Pae_TR]